MSYINKRDIRDYAFVIGGTFLFSAGVNFFIVPLGLYSGGVIGIAQIIRTLFVDQIGVQIPGGIDIAGIINLALNLPLFLIAYKSISRKFFAKTLVSVAGQTLFMTMLIIPQTPIIDDVLASAIIGGIMGGVGIGFALRAGGSGGGLDILGVYFSKKYPRFSVGKLSIMINSLVFGACAFLFEIPIAIYSVVYAACMSVAMDKVHYQNINMSVMIFTKHDGVQKRIMQEMVRGVTYWKGAGAYTNEETFVLVTVVSKYEISTIKKIIHSLDPRAFVIISEGSDVSGNFEKRL